MKISSNFKTSTLNLSRRDRSCFLLRFCPQNVFLNESKNTKQTKLKAILEKSTFQIPIFEIFISNGSFCDFYSNLPKTFFILKTSRKKSRNLRRAPFKYSKWKFSNQIDSGLFVKIITRNSCFFFFFL